MNMNITKNQLYAGLVVDLMVLLIVAAFIWPIQQAKNSQADMQISQDLSAISSELDSHFYASSELPQMLSEVSLSDDLNKRASENNYEYSKLSYASYELCAVFKTDTTDTAVTIESTFSAFNIGADVTSLYPNPDSNTYVHTEGRNCFTFNTADTYFEDAIPSSSPLGDFNLEGLGDITLPDGYSLDDDPAQLLEIFNISPSDL